MALTSRRGALPARAPSSARDPTRTLESLYLEPLAAQVGANRRSSNGVGAARCNS